MKKGSRRCAKQLDRDEIKASKKASKHGKCRNPNGSSQFYNRVTLGRKFQPNDWKDWE